MIARIQKEKQTEIRALIREAKRALDACEQSEEVPFDALVLSKALSAAAQRAEHLAGYYITSGKLRADRAKALSSNP